jgi:hypothetical protein
MSHPRVFEWHKQFLERTESVKDDERPVRPRTSVTVKNTQKVRDVIREKKKKADSVFYQYLRWLI